MSNYQRRRRLVASCAPWSSEGANCTLPPSGGLSERDPCAGPICLLLLSTELRGLGLFSCEFEAVADLDAPPDHELHLGFVLCVCSSASVMIRVYHVPFHKDLHVI